MTKPLPRAVAAERLQLPDEPIFNELAQRWTRNGRTVPGAADPQWTDLVERPAWPTAGIRRPATASRAVLGRVPPRPRQN